MKKTTITTLLFFLLLGLISNLLRAQPIIIDHNCAFLEPIPESAILQARDSLHIAYGHTSHGSQITEGMNGLANQSTNLIGYKGDIYCWDYYPENMQKENPCLDLHDYFRPGDLGHNGSTQWAISTRDYLDNDPESDNVNVIMWSWCGGCSDNTYDGIQTYLDTMNELEIDYPDIKFVYMTGHAAIWADETVKANNQHIRDYCNENDKILFDFVDIEMYDPDNNYFEFVNDDCTFYDSNHNELGNWATSWQQSHTEEIDWYDCYAAHTQPLNGNRKAYAAWWMFARIAGWDGLVAIDEKPTIDFDFKLSPNPTTAISTLQYSISEKSIISLKVFDTYGKLVKKTDKTVQTKGQHNLTINLWGFPKGVYLCVLNINENKKTEKLIVR